MRVLFVSHYFPPELGAAAPRTYESARRLAELGHEVTVLTGFPHYPAGVIAPAYRGRRWMRERMDGVQVVRSWVWATPNRTAVRRILNQLSLAATSLLGARGLGRVDVVVVESPPLLLAVSGYLISRWKGAPLVLRVADLWPASAVRLGVVTNAAVVKAAEALERFICRRADRILAVTAGIRDDLVGRGLGGDRVCHLPNGVDTGVFSPERGADSLRERFGLGGKFVVLYAGNIGLAQGLDSVLDAAALLRSQPDVQFVLAGEGVERVRLEERVRREGLSNVSFVGAQPREMMPSMLNMADAALVPLVDDPFFEMAVPSKLLEAMACQRPSLLAARGESERLLTEAGAGLAVPPGDPAALAEAIARLKGDEKARAEMGRLGREYVRRHRDWSVVSRQLEGILRDITEKSSVRESAAAHRGGSP